MEPTVLTNPPPREPAMSPLPPVYVTARKEVTDAQLTPVSVSAVTADTLADARITAVREAAVYAPNVVMTDFSARKLSNPRFRGLGASPLNPAVTTYYDGVPQFNASSASLELIDVEQIEFVRGPQGALFGRNTVGGLINITSTRPSLQDWRGSVTGTFGNYNLWDGRASVSGPLRQNELAASVGAGWSSREGYTENDVTGHDLDSREAFFGKGQLLWQPYERCELRLLLSGERARDGDYALGDLAAIRARPHHVARDFEGHTTRDVLAPTLLANYWGERLDVSLITGGVWWKTDDATDLDYSPAPLAVRHNAEEATQFTQEIRVTSPKDSPWTLSDRVQMRWQSGVFVFVQGYDQRAFNDLNPPLAPIPMRSLSRAALDDWGLGVYCQSTLTFWERLDLSVGARGDYENKRARLGSSTVPAFGPPLTQKLDDEFGECSPQATALYRFTPDCAGYLSVARGFKAGGFNAASPPGTEAYGQEDSWNYEAGFKTRWCEGRLTANCAFFYTHWDNLQLNVPSGSSQYAPYYIANVGAAHSKGAEFEMHARPYEGWDVFASVGYNDARFLSGSESGGASVGGNHVPFTPDYTASGGMQYALHLGKQVSAYARAEVILSGRFFYDDQNTEGQSAYTLANFRAGLRGKHWFAEGWVKNAFDTEYVPVALAYPGLAPSGFIAEAGAPLTFGVTAGARF
ncbi:MAG: TonB-dependent receptor [Verrucomicrobiae bacterium]|nr:TonB-dependent receptor [Verrucomicrobiae bacterium]